MRKRLPLILGLVLTAAPLAAGPLGLTFPVPATQTGARVDAPARVAYAISGFDGTQVPSRLVEGALDLRAYRLDGVRGNTLALMQPLQAQVEQAGYLRVFDCTTTACGGFDFRFGIEVLPEPQMHVDLGDFHYYAGQNPAGDVVTLLVSRAADQGFVQVTTVIKGAVAAVPAAPPLDLSQPTPTAPQPMTAPPTPEPQLTALNPQPPPPDPDSLDAGLRAQGTVALDDLVFASGKAVLEEGDYASLAALALWLRANPDLTVTLVGHTDASGSLAGNVALSKQRAVAVRTVLIQQYDLPAGQMDAQGAGYLAPRASNQTPEGRQRNRRVEVMLTSTP